MQRKLALLLALVELALPAASQAHVAVKPKRADAETVVTLRVEVENESTTASTVKFDVLLPRGMQDVEPRPPSGWSAKVVRSGGEDRRVVVTAKGEGVKFGPGEVSKTFPMSARLPERAGRLAFKVLQTYDNGDVVRWIGPRGSAEPSAFMSVVAAPTSEAAPAAASEPDPVADSSDGGDDGGGNGWVLPVVLAAAAAGVVLGLIAWRRRRTQAR